MACDWQTDRGQINHNWLQNGVLVGLNHALSVITGKVRVRHFRQTLADDIQRWLERKQDIPWLLDRIENEISPRVFFNQVPLCYCADETKEWLAPLIHEIWLRRERVEERIRVVIDAYQTTERTFATVIAALDQLPEAATVDSLTPFEPLLREFTIACEALSQAISVLPHQIKVV